MEENQSVPDTKTYQVVGPKKHRSKKMLMWLLILLLIGASGYGGWYYQQQKIDDLNLQIKQLKEAASQPTEAEQDVVRVQLVRPADKSYSVEAPLDWLSGTCEDSAVVFLAPTSDLLGKCATEFFGMVSISKQPGDNLAVEADFSDDSIYSDVSFTSTSINGVNGVKISHTQVGAFEVGPVAGTKTISYQLFDGTNTYIISYSEQPGWPDHSDDFELIAQSFEIL